MTHDFQHLQTLNALGRLLLCAAPMTQISQDCWGQLIKVVQLFAAHVIRPEGTATQ